MILNKKLMHLHWRAGFGLSPDEYLSEQELPITNSVQRLFAKAKEENTPLEGNAFAGMSREMRKKLSKEEKKRLKKEARKQVHQVNILWVKRMSNPQNSALLEKMSLFWHGHFACTSRFPKLALAQLNTIRKHALGNFRDLLLDISRDVAMIRFLNNQQNVKRKPNENFARELMELFTIGRGHYTESDIKAAARAFTGWSSTLDGKFVFRSFQHDYGQKTFMGKSGNFDGTDIIDILLEKRETARFIATKAYRFFVNEKTDEDHIDLLANTFYESGYDISALMMEIFSSDWFYEPLNIGTKIKSPLELLAGIMRTLDVEFENPLVILFLEKAMGQVLFAPPNVAGWPGGKAWIDNATLMLRLNLANYLAMATDFNFRNKAEFENKQTDKAMKKIKASVNVSPFVNLFAGKPREKVQKEMSAYLLRSPSAPPMSVLHNYSRTNDESDYIKLFGLRLMTLPEYQLC